MPSLDDRPRLRGVLHQCAAFVALVVAIAFVIVAPSPRAKAACAVFGASHVVQLVVSALYHRVTWSTNARAWMRRADHAMIFILIAGSATPFALLSMPADLGAKLMLLFWGGSAAGVGVTLFWPTRPKWIMAVLCIALGWAGAPLWLDDRSTLDRTTVTLLASAGALYSAGAVIYALKRPHLSPSTFGYHELFHALTIAAAVLTFTAAARLIE